jgi:putative DNA-invertase from lambdoid prophage Rac
MHETPARCAIWARVSSYDQESENQARELREWAARLGCEIVSEFILDDNSAWKGEHRAEMDRALTEARQRKWDVLLCWALDRLSREGIEATLAAMRRFHERGAPVWSLKEDWTYTSDPHIRQLIAAIMAWVAQMESQRRSERVKAGLARRRAEGKPVGGRKRGARDRAKRKTGGYLAEAERRRQARAKAAG